MYGKDFWTRCAKTNWADRNDPKPYWRRIHRHYLREAVRELRYLTGRPSKRRNVPCAYGHAGL